MIGSSSKLAPKRTYVLIMVIERIEGSVVHFSAKLFFRSKSARLSLDLGCCLFFSCPQFTLQIEIRFAEKKHRKINMRSLLVLFRPKARSRPRGSSVLWVTVIAHLLWLHKSSVLLLGLKIFLAANSAIVLSNWPCQFNTDPCATIRVKVLQKQH